jgi:tripartite-type tricarboxylate transporter receptor subunit TctC
LLRGSRLKIAGLAFLLGLVSQGGAAQEPDDFYAGKTIELLIGFGPGGTYDFWARAIARHMPEHIEGNPTIVPQNFPGAGGLRLINQLYNRSAKDGTVIGVVSRGIVFEPLLGGQGVQFDPLAMNWIGSPDKDVIVCAARQDAAVKTAGDLLATELVVGATGSGGDTAINPEFLASLLGMKFNTILGYPGSKEIANAMERGEVDGVCLAHDSLMTQTLARSGELNLLFQAALDPDPRLGNIPSVSELVQTEDVRPALELFFARTEVGRPFVAPPDIPEERLAILRKAFEETMRDPELLEEARRLQLNPFPITGEDIARVVAEAYEASTDVVQRTQAALGRVAE